MTKSAYFYGEMALTTGPTPRSYPADVTYKKKYLTRVLLVSVCVHSSYEPQLSTKDGLRHLYFTRTLSVNSKNQSHRPFHTILLHDLLRLGKSNTVSELINFRYLFYSGVRRFIRLFLPNRYFLTYLTNS